MTSTEQIVEVQAHNLTQLDAKQPTFRYCTQGVQDPEGSSSDPDGLNAIAADADIQATMQRIRMMKIKQIELGIREAFLRRILEAKTPEDAVPTPQQVAKLDISLGKEKSKLRAIKAERAAAEKSLLTLARTIESASASRDRARAQAANTLDRANAASRLQAVQQAVGTGDPQLMHEQVRNIEQHDAASCQYLIRELRSQKHQLEKEAASQSIRTDDLSKQVDALERKDRELEEENKSLEQRVSEHEKHHSDQSALQKEWARQEKLEELMAALVGFRVREVHASGISLEINASVFEKKGEKLRSDDGHSHKLYVEFEANDVGDMVISQVSVDPPDVIVSDLVKSLNLSMETGIAIVFSRFRRLYDKTTTRN